MSLVHYVRPFLELGICKEYSMARKTTGTTTTTRSKKAETSVQPAAVQAAPEVPKLELVKEVRKSGKSTSGTAAKASSSVAVNIEEQIRVRAYELYLERRATSGGDMGDQNQDWLVAEREIRSRQDGQEQQTA
jgi:Protein of unknown function (DUF2934)